MKKITLLIAIVFISNVIFAQDKVNRSKSSQKEDGKIFLNLGGGFNNPFGPLGIGLDVAVHPHVMVGTGAGISTWGTKIMMKGMYFFKEHYHGSALGISIQHNSGINYDNISYLNTNNNITYQLDVVGSGITSTNFMYANYRNLGKKSKFYMQTGIVAKFNNPTLSVNYANTSTPYVNTDYTSGVNLFKPGGLVANLGFLIALN